jgi:hypothetical protein
MSRIFVIAGTYQEATNWIKQDLEKRYPSNTSASMSDYKYVSHADDVKGYTNPHGVFVGNWLGRPDICEIVEALLMRSTYVNTALGDIYKQVKPKTRPIPKQPPLHKVAGGYAIAVQDAADLLAREIDAEVLKSLMKTTGV